MISELLASVISQASCRDTTRSGDIEVSVPSSLLFLVLVFIPQGCSHTVPQSSGLKTVEIHSLSILEATGLDSGAGRPTLPPHALGEPLSLFLWFLLTLGTSQLVTASMFWLLVYLHIFPFVYVLSLSEHQEC